MSCCTNGFVRFLLSVMCDNQQLVEKEIAKVHGKNKQNQRAYCAFGVDYFKRQFNTAFPKYCICLGACKQSTTNIPLAAAGGNPKPQTDAHTHIYRKWTWERKHISAVPLISFLCVHNDRSMYICIKKERRPAPKKPSQGSYTQASICITVRTLKLCS